MSKQTKLRQAAVLIRSLPKSQSAKLLGKLQAHELRAVFQEMRRLPDIAPDELTNVLLQFIEAIRSNERTQPDKAQSALPQEHPPDSLPNPDTTTEPFGFLVALDESLQIRLLANEHPHNIALVLSMLATARASALMSRLDVMTRISVVRRLCDLDDFDQDEIERLARALRMRANKLLVENQKPQTGVRVASRLLSCIDGSTRDSIIDHLNGRDPDLARQLKSDLFQFKDLARMSNHDIRTILKHVDTAAWAPALKQADLETRKRILDNLAARPAEILSMEIAGMGPIAKPLAEQAQSHIVSICLELHDRGSIDLGIKNMSPTMQTDSPGQP